MVNFLKQNTSTFTTQFSEDIQKHPLADDGQIYITDDPTMARAIGNVAMECAVRAIFSFIDSFTEHNAGEVEVDHSACNATISELKRQIVMFQMGRDDLWEDHEIDRPPSAS